MLIPDPVHMPPSPAPLPHLLISPSSRMSVPTQAADRGGQTSFTNADVVLKGKPGTAHRAILHRQTLHSTHNQIHRR